MHKVAQTFWQLETKPAFTSLHHALKLHLPPFSCSKLVSPPLSCQPLRIHPPTYLLVWKAMKNNEETRAYCSLSLMPHWVNPQGDCWQLHMLRRHRAQLCQPHPVQQPQWAALQAASYTGQGPFFTIHPALTRQAWCSLLFAHLPFFYLFFQEYTVRSLKDRKRKT